MKKYIFLLLSISLFAESKEIAITFDDAPRKATGYFSGPERAKALIEELSNHNIQHVAFFANSASLNDEGIQRINSYDQAGHTIANHTHNHPDFNKTSLDKYIQNFLLADKTLSQFDGFKKLFRFPYLREGNNELKRDGMRQALQEYNYNNAYITLNNYDWYIETLFQQAIKKGIAIDFERMGQFYVQVMMESIEYYDEMAQRYLGRSPKHVLLLHETDISALYVGNLVDELRTRGWKIISPEEAYTDEISKYQSKRVFPYNPGRIGEIAKDKGQNTNLWHKTLDEKYLEQRFITEVTSFNLGKDKKITASH